MHSLRLSYCWKNKLYVLKSILSIRSHEIFIPHFVNVQIVYGIMLAPKLLVISHKCVLMGSFLKQRSNENTEKAASLGDEHENKLRGHDSAQWGSHIRQERQLQLTSETHF